MRTQHLVLGVFAALLCVGAANASPDRQIDDFIDRAKAQAETLVNSCGVDLGRERLTVQAYIGPDGRLKSVALVGSTGPHDSDRAIVQALKRISLDDVPPQLIEAKLTFRFGQSAAGLPNVP